MPRESSVASASRILPSGVRLQPGYYRAGQRASRNEIFFFLVFQLHEEQRTIAQLHMEVTAQEVLQRWKNHRSRFHLANERVLLTGS